MTNKKDANLDAVAGKAGTWYTIGNILLKGCMFFTLPIFTNLLSTAEFGIYNTYMAYEALITAVLGMGLYGTVKNAKLDYKEKFDEYLSSVLSFSFLVLLGVLIFANAFYGLYGKMLGFSRVITNCLILQSFGSYLIFFYGAKLNIEFKYKSFIAMSCFNTIGNIVFSVLLIKFVFPHERYLGRIIGSAAPLIMLSIVISIYLLLRGRRLYDRKYWRYAVVLGLPLVPHVVSQSLLSQFDRIMITKQAGDSPAGIYSYICTICTIMNVICSSFDNAWTPWVYMKLKDKSNDQIRKASRDYILFFAILTLGFICVMPEVSKLIANKSYWYGIDLIIPLSLSNFCIFLYMLPVNIEYYNKKTKFISVGTFAAAMLNLGLNFIAIMIFGYKAAAYTTLISYIALFAFHWFIAKRLENSDVYELKYILKITGGLFALSFLILIVSKLTSYEIILRYLVVVCILGYLFKRREFLIDFVRGRR